SGVLGNSLHRMPQIGELSPGLWLASAFGGHGINTTAMAGNILAQAIVEGDDTWRLFAPFELVWAGGRAGRMAMQALYWWVDKRERVAARAARQREEEDQRVAERAALRAGEGEAGVEAQVGAVVPRAGLPAEPSLAGLPADPVSPKGISSPPVDPGGRHDPPPPPTPHPLPPTSPSLIPAEAGIQKKSLDPPLAARQEGQALEQVHVLLVLDERAVQRRNEFHRVALAQRFGADAAKRSV